MPLQFDTPQTVKPAEQSGEVHCVGINIRLPRDGAATVTYYYEALDADGNVVDRRAHAEPVADIMAEQPADFSKVHAILKARAYAVAPRAGYPSGGEVS